MAGILDHVQLHLVESYDDLKAFMAWVWEPREILGVDTETSGLSPELDYIRLIQFGDENHGWALAWDDWKGPIRQVLETYPGLMVFHNSKFDIRHICEDFGWLVADWSWHLTHDTMCMAHILDSQRPKGLKPLAARYVDGKAVAAQRSLDEGMRANKWTWATVPIKYPPYWQYGAMDPVLTVYMFKAFKEVLTTYPHLYDLEMGAVRAAAKMEQRGIRIDIPYCHRTRDTLMTYASDARYYLQERWGIQNPTAMQLIKFFEAQGVELPDKRTASGRQAMDAEVMDAIHHEAAQITQAIKRAEKFSHTYLDNFVKFADPRGYLHPSINTMAARTARMSITEPALQTLPRMGDTIRNAFVPSDGSGLLTIDADQIEARLTAHFSRDPGLIAAFLADGDFFCNIAGTTYGYPVEKGMTERDLIKKVVYGKVYGSAVAKMAISAGVPIQQMEIANASFDQNFPGVRVLQSAVINEGKRRSAQDPNGRGFVITPYGRKLMSDRSKEYTLVNYLIQCHAAEILKKKISMLDAALPDEAKMVLPVHDEIIFDVPLDIIHEVKMMAEEVLNESEDYLVPITWSGDILLESWGEKYRPKVKAAA